MSTRKKHIMRIQKSERIDVIVDTNSTLKLISGTIIHIDQGKNQITIETADTKLPQIFTLDAIKQFVFTEERLKNSTFTSRFATTIDKDGNTQWIMGTGLGTSPSPVIKPGPVEVKPEPTETTDPEYYIEPLQVEVIGLFPEFDLIERTHAIRTINDNDMLFLHIELDGNT